MTSSSFLSFQSRNLHSHGGQSNGTFQQPGSYSWTLLYGKPIAPPNSYPADHSSLTPRIRVASHRSLNPSLGEASGRQLSRGNQQESRGFSLRDRGVHRFQKLVLQRTRPESVRLLDTERSYLLMSQASRTNSHLKLLEEQFRLAKSDRLFFVSHLQVSRENGFLIGGQIERVPSHQTLKLTKIEVARAGMRAFNGLKTALTHIGLSELDMSPAERLQIVERTRVSQERRLEKMTYHMMNAPERPIGSVLFSALENPQFQGTVQVVFGFSEVNAGIAAGPAGIVIAAHGLDQIYSGIGKIATGKYCPTATEQLLQKVGVPSQNAAFINDLVGGKFAVNPVNASKAIKTVPLAMIKPFPTPTSVGSPALSSLHGLRLRNELIAREIAGGHAFEKHILVQGEFPGWIRTREQFEKHIRDVLENFDGITILERGRVRIAHKSSGTRIFRDPKAVDGGTAFQFREKPISSFEPLK